MAILRYLLQGNFVQALIYFIGSLVIIFLVLPLHEFAHGFVADKLGDPTARYAGRLSLNPMVHIDWLGALLILAVGFGWARPVPVNTRYFKHIKRDMALTALAGPVANLLAALVALLLGNAAIVLFAGAGGGSVALSVVYQLFSVIAEINIGLAVFNLIPIPPLDGSRLLTALLPNRLYYKVMQYERYIILGLFALVFLGVLDVPLNFLRSVVYSGLRFLAALPFGLL